jgi:hypothetical protein
VETYRPLGKYAEGLAINFELAFGPFIPGYTNHHNHNLQEATLALRHMIKSTELMLPREELEAMLSETKKMIIRSNDPEKKSETQSRTEHGWLSLKDLREFEQELEVALSKYPAQKVEIVCLDPDPLERFVGGFRKLLKAASWQSSAQK